MLLLIVGLGFLSYKFTLGFFSDTETSTGNLFAAASSFGTPTPTPTPSPAPGPEDVVINEVFYNVCVPANLCGNDPHDEWIELYNKTSSLINIQNWTITDDQSTDTITTSATFIPAGGFALISHDLDTWIFWGEPEGTLKISLEENIGNGLGDNGDRVILKDGSGTVIDVMSYGNDNSQLNPSVPDSGQGHSLERDPDGIDTGSAADFVNKITPAPGT